MRKLILLFVCLLAALPCFAQTFDVYGGLLTYTNGATAPVCTWPNAAYELPISAITGNGVTATVTLASTASLGLVGNHKTIFVVGVTNTGFNVTAASVLATITSSTQITYANATNATSSGGNVVISEWYSQEINSQEYLCSPTGHIFQSFHPVGIIGTIHNTCAITTAGNPGVLDRVESWGFNTLTVNAYSGGCNGTYGIWPWNTTQTLKAPGIPSFDPAFRSMINSSSYLSDPVKDILDSRASAYNAFRFLAVPDEYDSNIGAWIAADMSAGGEPWAAALKNTTFDDFAIGFYSDDSDYMNGISGATWELGTTPNGPMLNLGMVIATSSPLQTAATNVAGTANSFVYTRTQIYSKIAWRNALATEYGTIGALNTAWGTGGVYTTFDSTGTCVGSQPITCATSVAADSVGTGDGTTLTFSATLSHHTGISAFSCQILVAGTPVAGCTSAEGSATYSFYGPNVSSGSINPTTGAFTITFAAGHAPANAAAITATYVDCGWGCGTGLLDEDGRHTTWTGNVYAGATNGSSAFNTDAMTFIQSIAGEYFSQVKSNVQATFPWLRFFGPETLGEWGLPPNSSVLKAANIYCSAVIIGGGTAVLNQAGLNFVQTNYGTHPIFNAWYGTANNDSQYNKAFSGAFGDFATQAAQAAAYYAMIQAQLTTAVTSSGDKLYAGSFWWEYPAQSFEGDGLVTPTDNAYNGVEPTSGSVPCSTPVSLFTCGSEPAPAANGGTAARPYGDLLTGATSVTTANQLWLKQPSVTAPVVPAPTSLIAQVAKIWKELTGSL